MNKKKEQPVAKEAELFRQALDGVVPLAPDNRITPAASPRRTVPRNTAIGPAPVADNLSDHGAEDTLLTEFMPNGLSRMTLRKLRRGVWPVQDSLDLHGLNSDDARKLLLEFLLHAVQHGLRCVCVIHGKGRHTGGVGILKARARHWLTQCAEVLAFCEAPSNLGGGGAVLVLLKVQN
ncbi:MAG: Smr/MutS family protein [Gallionellaceae bacterium]